MRFLLSIKTYCSGQRLYSSLAFDNIHEEVRKRPTYMSEYRETRQVLHQSIALPKTRSCTADMYVHI